MLNAACERMEIPQTRMTLLQRTRESPMILNQLGQHERAVAHKEQSINFRRQHVDAQTELLNQLEIALSGLTKAAS